eukprot:Em0001g2500a
MLKVLALFFALLTVFAESNGRAVHVYSEDGEIVTQDEPGTIYIIQTAGTNYYKIGRTTRNVNERLAELQVGNPLLLVVRAQFVVTANVAAENAALTAARNPALNYRNGVTGGTEWFNAANYVDFRNVVSLAVNPYLVVLG